MKSLSIQFGKFAIAGTIGFIVDAAALLLFIRFLSIDRYSARVLSFCVAVTVTWMINSRWSFQQKHNSTSIKHYTNYASYVGVQITGAFINIAVYSTLISVSGLLFDMPVFALAIGSIVAMVFNFVGCKLLVF